jgi:hypothetical protein
MISILLSTLRHRYIDMGYLIHQEFDLLDDTDLITSRCQIMDAILFTNNRTICHTVSNVPLMQFNRLDSIQLMPSIPKCILLYHNTMPHNLPFS